MRAAWLPTPPRGGVSRPGHGHKDFRPAPRPAREFFLPGFGPLASFSASLYRIAGDGSYRRLTDEDRLKLEGLGYGS